MKRLIIVLAIVAMALSIVPSVTLAGGDVGVQSVSDYAILFATQTGPSQVVVTVQAYFCPSCNPNDSNDPGCPEFTHGYPPPVCPYNWYGNECYTNPGRYVAVRVSDSGGTVIGTQKMVCNPSNWPLGSIIQRDIVVNTSVPITGSSLTIEADIFCSWCGHWYPCPITIKIRKVVIIDIKPCMYPNSIRLCSPCADQFVQVAVLSTSVAKGEPVNFDAGTIDPRTVRFGPWGAKPIGWYLADLRCPPDFDKDLILTFRVSETGIMLWDTEATLTGETYDGASFIGKDSVKPVCGCLTSTPTPTPTPTPRPTPTPTPTPTPRPTPRPTPTPPPTFPCPFPFTPPFRPLP